jgi:serine/threonine-protein kinase RsbW
MKKNELEVDIKVPNQTRYLSLIGKIGEDIARELSKYGGDRETLAYHINLVLTEAMVNAIKYADTDDPDRMVHILINISEHEIQIKVYDNGQGFDINSIPPRTSRRWKRADGASFLSGH